MNYKLTIKQVWRYSWQTGVWKRTGECRYSATPDHPSQGIKQ